MTTADTPGCAACPLKGDAAFVPDQLVRLAPVVVLLDRPGDPPVSDRLLGLAKLRRGTNVSFAHAFRCEASKRVRSGKKFEAALAACRAHDDFAGASLVVCGGPAAWRALGWTDWTVARGYVREVNG